MWKNFVFKIVYLMQYIDFSAEYYNCLMCLSTVQFCYRSIVFFSFSDYFHEG